MDCVHGVVNVTFELWGAGAAGARACCCMYSKTQVVDLIQ